MVPADVAGKTYRYWKPKIVPVEVWNRRLSLSGIKKFKPMADFDWNWPKKIERDVIERALTLDFIKEARNLILIGQNGLGKTMIAKNICHAAVLAGYSVMFRTASALDRRPAVRIANRTKKETAQLRQCRTCLHR